VSSLPHNWPLYPWERALVSTKHDSECAPKPVWAFWRTEDLIPNGTENLDQPALRLVTIPTTSWIHT